MRVLVLFVGVRVLCVPVVISGWPWRWVPLRYVYARAYWGPIPSLAAGWSWGHGAVAAVPLSS